MPTAMPIIRMIALTVCSSVGTRWLARRFTPIAARTAENASRTGSPAATIAPKATTRMRMVSGSDVYSARFMSPPKRFSSALFADASPNCATITLGLPACAWSTAFMIGPTLSCASSGSPLMSNWTSSECWSSEISPAFGWSMGETMFVTSF
jgi:hypothetical protein